MSRLSYSLYVALLATSNISVAQASPSDVFNQWGQTQWVNRSVHLNSLGITTPAVFDYASNMREFYLPVPKDIPIDNASMILNGSYLRANGGNTTMSVSIDGYPVAAQKFNDNQGTLNQVIGVDGLPRQTGFVRLGVQWASFLYERLCSNNTAIGNNLTVDPNKSIFQYRYNKNLIKDVSLAVSALPISPTILTSHVMSKSAYDTAWRVGLELEHRGKKVQFKALPAVGDTIDLSKVVIPEDLKNIPAFNALSTKNTAFQIKDLAQLGALIALGENGPLTADIAIQDSALNNGLTQAVQALRNEINTSAPQSLNAFDTYIFQRFSLLKNTPSPSSVGLYSLGGLPTIAISAESQDNIAKILAPLWPSMMVTPSVVINKINEPKIIDNKILLSRLSGYNNMIGSLDIVSHADRSMTFDLGDIAKDGYIPSQVSFDVSGAPDVNNVTPIVSIFFNDFLLGAEQLNNRGKPQRMTVDIPSYALSAKNTIRVAFYRQPTQALCQEPSIAYPVSILPGSHLNLKKQSLGDNFIGMTARFADPTDLIIPDNWLNTPNQSLPQLVSTAYATGISTESARLLINSAQSPAKPDHPFLAFNVDDKDTTTADYKNGKLVLKGATSKDIMLDADGLTRLSTLEVTKAFGQTGVLYHVIGKEIPKPEQSYRLTQGNLAVIGDRGVLLQMDKNDPSGAEIIETSNPQSIFEKYMWVWGVLVAIFVFALLAARVAYVRRKKSNASSEK